MTYFTVNPTTNEVLRTYSYLQEKDIEQKIDKALQTFRQWKMSDVEKRRTLLIRLGEILSQKEKFLAETMAKEMGKPLVEGAAEIKKCVSVCQYYAENLESFLQRQEVSAHYKQTFVSFQPLGPLLAIMPWNFPFWQFFRFAVPALAGGNVVLLKHAEITSACAEEIEKIFYECNVELHLVQNLRLQHDQAARVIRDPRVQGVSFTGSTRGGRQVAQVAAEVLKKCVLELGGSDAYIVCEDADLELAARTSVQSRLVNNGQSCVAGKRFLVHKNIFKKFTELYVHEMNSYVLGNPLEINTRLGPLAHRKFLKNIVDQIHQFEAAKAKRIDGTQQLPSRGTFIRPGVLLMDKAHPLFLNEEVFGPLALLLPFDSLEEAADIVNASPYGLGAGIFSAREEEMLSFAETQLFAGMVTVNDYVKSDPRVPFGGVKNSGYGRELGSFGFREFLNIKTVGCSPQKKS